jgi:dTDP-glucose 4,6-dehydratase
MSSTTAQTFIVTGAAGFIGSTFAELAVANGRRVIALDALTYAGHRENLTRLEGSKNFELVVGNICDPALVRQLFKKHQPVALINFAAESHVDRSIDSPGDFLETNIQGTFNLLSHSLEYWKSLIGEKASQFRYLQISTDEVFGSLGAQGKFSETTPYAPNSPYSASKASADLLVRAWHHTYGLPTLTTHCSNNYGPRQFPEKLIPHMIHCALSGRRLPVYGDGGNVRDWIHVEDHCRGVLLALEKGIPGSTYCFGGDAERNNLDVVRTICRELDQLRPRDDGKSYDSSIEFVTDRPGHDRRYAIDSSFAQSELGFQRQYTFEQGLKATISWYLENQAWCESVTQKKAMERIGLGKKDHRK